MAIVGPGTGNTAGPSIGSRAAGDGAPDYSSLKTDLLSWWDFASAGDGTDSHGPNNLTAKNSPLAVSAPTLDGTGFRRQWGTAAVYDMLGVSWGGADINQDFTCCCWLMVESNTTTGNLQVINHDPYSGSNRFNIYRYGTNGETLRVLAGSSSLYVTDAAIFSRYTWDHIIVECHYTAKQIKVQVNGDLSTVYTQATTNNPYLEDNGKLSVGMGPYGGTNHVGYRVDSLAFWKRHLTDEEKGWMASGMSYSSI